MFPPISLQVLPPGDRLPRGARSEHEHLLAGRAGLLRAGAQVQAGPGRLRQAGQEGRQGVSLSSPFCASCYLSRGEGKHYYSTYRIWAHP